AGLLSGPALSGFPFQRLRLYQILIRSRFLRSCGPNLFPMAFGMAFRFSAAPTLSEALTSI
ncbi:hypothetical protein, partial [Streptomyces sp. NPDC053542]|uniref:hypothetical protein n=1 Tax=Streptomyces sp. NPDC053542 TaxID=3365710 RepID=UPI0037D65C28